MYVCVCMCIKINTFNVPYVCMYVRMYLRNRLSAKQTGLLSHLSRFFELLVALISRVSPTPIITAETEEHSIKLLLFILIKDKNVCWMYVCIYLVSIFASVHTSCIFIYIHTYIHSGCEYSCEYSCDWLC